MGVACTADGFACFLTGNNEGMLATKARITSVCNAAGLPRRRRFGAVGMEIAGVSTAKAGAHEV